jgi:uncharacterized RDD family membrane protein YckC
LAVGSVSRRTFANFRRRLGALVVDLVVVEAMIPNLPIGVVIKTPGATATSIPSWVHGIAKHAHVLHAVDGSGGWGVAIFYAYLILLVGLAGQTFGMMIMDLRVVTDQLGRAGVARAVLRYLLLAVSLVGIVGLLRMFSRVQPFEKWSGTRLIAGTAYARYRERLTAQPFEAVPP